MARHYTGWNTELIIKTLQELNTSGADLRDINAQKSYRKLYRAARAHLGSWRNALEQAGINYSDIKQRVYGRRREQEKNELLIKLKSAYESGVKLNRGSIINDQENKILYWNSKKFFHGRMFWEDALTAAGLNPKKIVVQRRWTNERIKEIILKRKSRNLPLDRKSLGKYDRLLIRAIDKRFHSYESTLRYAGIDPYPLLSRREHTKDGLLKLIKDYNEKGVSLKPSEIIKKGGDKELRSVFYAASKRFDGWWNALSLAGVDPSKYLSKHRGIWSKKKVVKGIEARIAENLSLDSSSVTEDDNALYKAGLRYHGSWENAVEAAGRDYSEIRKNTAPLSKEEIIAKIKELNEQGKNLNGKTILADENPEVRSLFIQGSRKFKGWKNAITATGLDYSKIRLHRKHSLRMMKQKILEIHLQGGDLTPKGVAKDPEVHAIYRAAYKRFGSWYTFLDKIGIDSSKYLPRADWKNGEGVLEALRKRFPSGIVTGIRGEDRNLAQAVCMYFRSVRNASEKAGMVYSRGGKITKNALRGQEGAVGRLCQWNKPFIQNIANRVYEGAIERGISPVNKDELNRKAYLYFLDLLIQKPAKQDLREFIKKPMYVYLIDLHRENAWRAGKEHLWGEKVYFDISSSKNKL